ncbi:NAD-dependent epimerase/dehydratase family protein [Kaistia granuli]|uniref:NAD-dependent epimerase/dehydratase family protein n=1 Tax=Kaistia granuli TaxID=363259 RepID=UPI00037268A9|nr:NAD-dependent epimerase/dehydratase family protein [Kaistia granuli]
MTRVVVIGGSGHVGTYLVPRLVEAGFEVVNVTRGARAPYQPHAAWQQVETVTIDREALDRAGTFGATIADLKPDIVIDMICFTMRSAELLADALRGRVQHFLHTGTIWVHGPSVSVPTTETAKRRPFGDYGTQKAEIEAYLLQEAQRNGFPVTIVHPGHIVGRGWAPLNPAGHFDPAVFSALARGDQLLLPNFGLETVHHVHADDVAQMFMKAIAHWSQAVGEAFHTVSPQAVTLRGYAETVSSWFGHEANLAYLPWEEWKLQHSAEIVEQTYDHIAHSPSCSIDKARHHLGYQPRFSSFEAVRDSLDWLIEQGIVTTG